MHSDPIADMATRMRNAVAARQKSVRIPYSKMKESILSVLKEKTFIKDFSVVNDGKFEVLEVTFSSSREELSIKRVSKPGHRIYKQAADIKPVRRGFGISVVSTSAGVMAGYEAFKQGIGGEILLEIY